MLTFVSLCSFIYFNILHECSHMVAIIAWFVSLSITPSQFWFQWKSLSSVRLFVDPMNYTVHGIFQTRMENGYPLEWVAIPFPRVLPNPEIEPRSPASQVDSSPSEPSGTPIIPSRLSQMTIFHLSYDRVVFHSLYIQSLDPFFC